jgi:hypothetical protein
MEQSESFMILLKTVMAILLIPLLLMVAMVASFIWFASDLSLETYPIRVNFSFDYDGSHIETSRYTVVKESSNNFVLSIEVGKYRWDPGRRTWSLALPSGALLVISPEWPSASQDFAPNKSYDSIGRWFWIDNPEAPREIVYGDGATRPWSGTDEFTSLASIRVEATIERASKALLSEALKSDNARNAADKLEYSNQYGGNQNFLGTLFTAVRIGAVADASTAEGAKIEQINNAPGWVRTPGNCRFKPIALADLRNYRDKYSDRVTLLSRNGIWNGDVGPHPGEPSIMYSTGTQVDSRQRAFSSVVDYRTAALQMIHAVEWQGEICSGIEATVGASAEAVQFPSGKLALLSPSDTFAIWHN